METKRGGGGERRPGRREGIKKFDKELERGESWGE